MFIRVDEDKCNIVEGFLYTNSDGSLEGVKFVSGKPLIDLVAIDYGDHMDLSSVHVKDIDNLIKALQAAKDSLTKES